MPTLATTAPRTLGSLAGRAAARVLAPAFARRLEALRDGELLLVDGARRLSFGRVDPVDPLRATITVHDPSFYAACALRGSLGAAESYVAGAWTADDLTAVVRLLARNRDALDAVDGRLARLARPWLRLAERLRPNDRAGARRHVAAHYDLSNDFFRLFLDDETLMYSCALFDGDGDTLAAAQRRKLARIAAKLELGPGDHVLEIGAGWGGFAIHAAREHGCRVTTTTISRAQHDLAVERVARAGLADRVEVLLEDYRDLRGRYDKVVSIEMIEAIGAEQHGVFFDTLRRRLRHDGAALVQSIVIADQQFERARREVDFIRRHVFPGSCIPSVTALCAAMTASSDLRLVHLEDITPSYVRTLAAWRARLAARLDEARALGCSEAFLRLWEFYFCYCEGGFAERVIGDVQLVFHRPGRRAPAVLGALGGARRDDGAR